MGGVSRGVEAVYVHDGNQEKVLVCDEGDNGTASKSLSIRADLPVSIALQYAENVAVDNRFIALYQIENEKSNFSTDSCRVRGRRSIRAESTTERRSVRAKSTTARAVRPNK